MIRVMNGVTVLVGSIGRRLRRLMGDEQGVSAIEFALLLPLMVSLYLGAVEMSQGIAADRKVTLTARSIGDLVSQVSSINNTDMSNALPRRGRG
jgi:Flp pilus assembly protein TadG